MSYWSREELKNMDIGVVIPQVIGILIGKALRGGFTTLGVCVVLKLFGVI